MNELLDNPVFNALVTGNSGLSYGNDQARYFDELVSPFAGFDRRNDAGFKMLHDLLPGQRIILFATPGQVDQTPGWNIRTMVPGCQMLYTRTWKIQDDFSDVRLLDESHVPQMLELTALTRPGPFSSRTIDFGPYYGIFHHDKLVAMAGQRLHVGDYLEISGVCTHPDHLGRGHATILLNHQVAKTLEMGKIPFLHVRKDNERAISVYLRQGFAIRTPMNFYVLQRVDER